MPNASRAFHSARRRREVDADGPARDERRALEHAHQRSLGQELAVAVRAAKPIARRALDAVVAREAAGHERRPDRRGLGGPQRGERTVGAPPREARERGSVRRAGDRHVRGREPVDADQDDATGGAARVELHRNGRRGRRELRPQGQGHGQSRRRGQDHERRRQGPVVTREEGQVEADRQEDERSTRDHDRGGGEGAQRLDRDRVAIAEQVEPVERGRDREGDEGERGEERAARRSRGGTGAASSARGWRRRATSARASVPPAAQGRKRDTNSARASRRSASPGFRKSVSVHERDRRERGGEAALPRVFRSTVRGVSDSRRRRRSPAGVGYHPLRCPRTATRPSSRARRSAGPTSS